MNDALGKSAFSVDFVNRAVAEIDRRIGDPVWINQWRCGTQDNPYWHIAVKGEAGFADKCELTRLYVTGAGWGDIEIITSSENGERPGLTGIKLFKNQQ
jgi:hypothetical protein